MINHIKMDITEVTTGVIIHGVNCLGVMGSGVAYAIRNKWPAVYNRYKEMPTGKKMLGQTHFICIDHRLYVGNCYTQLNFGSDGKRYADIDSIKSCLESAYYFADLNELDLYSPMIGCGLGGLNWGGEVEPIFKLLNTQYDRVNTIICNL